MTKRHDVQPSNFKPAPAHTPVPSPTPLNPAAFLISRVLKIKHPRPSEPDQYESQAEALTTLRRVTGLVREEMAFKLGMSTPQYDKAEAGSYGGALSTGVLDRCREIARVCNLPVMAGFFGMLKTHVRQQISKGGRGRPRKQDGVDGAGGKNWWRDGLERGEGSGGMGGGGGMEDE